MATEASAPTVYPEGVYPNSSYPMQPMDTAYDPAKQPMGPGVPQATSNPPPYQPYNQQQMMQPAPAQIQPQAVQQQSSSVVVVNSQPAVATTTVRVTNTDQSTLIFAIVVSLIAFFFLCWWTLLCSIPGMVFGYLASQAGGRGDIEGKKKYDKMSIGFTVTGIVCDVVMPIIIIGAAVGATVAGGAAVAGTVRSGFGSFG